MILSSPNGILAIQSPDLDHPHTSLFVDVVTGQTVSSLEHLGDVVCTLQGSGEKKSGPEWGVAAPTRGTSEDISFSAFASVPQRPQHERRLHRKLHNKDQSSEQDDEVDGEEDAPKKLKRGGDHVAFVSRSPPSETLYTAVVFRCDTWAVDWVVGPRPVEAAIHHCSILLSSQVLCIIGSGVEGNPHLVIAAAPVAVSVGSGSSVQRSFVASPKVFKLSDIPLMRPNEETKESFIHQREKGGAIGLPLAIAASSAESCIILFSSGSLYDVSIQRTVHNPSAEASGVKNAGAFPGSHTAAQRVIDVDISVVATYLGELPAAALRSFTRTEASSPNVIMKTLGSTTSAGARATVVAVYMESAVYLLPLLPSASSAPRWATVPVPSPYLVRDIELVEEGFGQSHTSSSMTSPSLLLLQLQSRTAPFSAAVQSALLVLPTSRGEGDHFEVVPQPLLALPAASLRIMQTWFDVSRHEWVVIGASRERASFFHGVLSPDSNETREKQKKRMDPVGEDDTMKLLAAYPQSWVCGRLPFTEEWGGYRSDAWSTAAWKPLLRDTTADPHRSTQEDSEAFPHLATEEVGVSPHDHRLPPIRLVYPLTAVVRGEAEQNKADAVHIRFFSVSVAAGLHTRLSKQMHNATHGLWLVVQQALRHPFLLQEAAAQEGLETTSPIRDTEASETASGLDCPLSLLLQHYWHPLLIRRVLKQLSADQLRQLLLFICTWINRSGTPPSSHHTWYYHAAGFAMNLAVQIILLAKQKGLALSSFLVTPGEQLKPNMLNGATHKRLRWKRCACEDPPLRPLLRLLRCGRGVGHPLRRALPALEMVLEAGRHRRLIRSLLLNQGGGESGSEVMASSSFPNEEAFLSGLRSALEGAHGGRTGGGAASRLKFTPNTWVSALDQQRESLRQTCEAAQGYLKELEEDMVASVQRRATQQKPSSASGGEEAPRLVDWNAWGDRPHADSAMRVFESGLIGDAL